MPKTKPAPGVAAGVARGPHGARVVLRLTMNDGAQWELPLYGNAARDLADGIRAAAADLIAGKHGPIEPTPADCAEPETHF